MLNFKTFKFVYSLNEKLTPEQESEVDKLINVDKRWTRDPEAVAATDHYFGRGNDVKTQQLEGTQDKSEVHKAVERHLGHEIHPDDYKEGHTTDKYGRKVRIGGLLAKSKAPKELVNGFATDSTRQGKKFTGLSVKVSRHPHDVAGQTSRGQSWEEQSCKNYETGSNRHYLPAEVKHGTVVGYLHDHTGKEIARTTLQPHINDVGNVAYAVDSHYGINLKLFHEHMKRVARELSGEHQGGSIVYKKHPKVYDDSGVREMLHPNATSEHIHKALNDEDADVRAAAARNPNATSEHLHKALSDKDKYVREAAARNPNATSEHLHKASDDKEGVVRRAAARHPNATSEHLHKALDDKDEYVRAAAASHPNANAEHLHKALSDKDVTVREAAARNPNANAEHLHKALSDKDVTVREVAASQPNATSEHLHKALSDTNVNVRRAAISHPYATSEHLHKALSDKYEYNRAAAASHPNANAEHLHKALSDDKDAYVRAAAAINPNATSEHLHKALSDKDADVRYNAIRNRNANAEHVHNAFSDEHYAVVNAAAMHPLATKEDLKKATFHQDDCVRETAKRRLKEMSQRSASK